MSSTMCKVGEQVFPLAHGGTLLSPIINTALSLTLLVMLLAFISFYKMSCNIPILPIVKIQNIMRARVQIWAFAIFFNSWYDVHFSTKKKNKKQKKSIKRGPKNVRAPLQLFFAKIYSTLQSNSHTSHLKYVVLNYSTSSNIGVCEFY